MSERWVGLTVSGEKVVVVDLKVPNCGPLVVEAEMTMPLPKGERPDAYAVIHSRVRDYMRENLIKNVVLKASAVPMGGRVSGAHLEAAELRGVVAAAAREGGADVHMVKKAGVSRTFGSRKVDEYLKDNSFWDENLSGQLRHGSREAAMMILSMVRSHDE